MDYERYSSLIKQGDRQAFRDYLEETYDSLFGMVFRMISDTQESEDIVQDTFIKVWEKRENLDRDSSLHAWTRRIAVNKSLDLLRRRKRYSFSGNHEFLHRITSEIDSERELEEKEVAELIDRLTEKLSPKQRIVFTLSELNGFSAAEIADYTGLSKDRIKSNLHLARKALRTNWKKYGYDG